MPENRRMVLQLPDPPPSWGRVALRRFRGDDVAMLQDLSTDPYLPLIGTLPADADEYGAREFIGRQHSRLETGAGYSFCVAEIDGDRAIGTAGLWLADLAHGRATVGYSVAPSARGRGLAVDALKALTDFGWTLPDLHRIELYVEPANVASVRIAEAAGYLREGLLRSHQPIGDRRADLYLYASLRPAGGPHGGRVPPRQSSGS